MTQNVNAGVAIRSLGFRSVRAFQRAWNLGPALAVDGVIGPLTTAAARRSWTRHRRGEGDMSPHFYGREFECHCGGTLDGCRRILICRELLQSLEKYREHYGHPVYIISGYRCAQHNKAVGGATRSQHLYGAAADIHRIMDIHRVEAWGLFSGIGYMRTTGLVAHVDRRDVSGHNTTNSTTTHPALWTY